MADTAAIRALAERLEQATGPDRELDAEIEDTIGEESEYQGSHLLGGFSRGRRDYLLHVSPHHTSSLDAAVALVERVRPGCNWNWCVFTDGPACFAWVEFNDAGNGRVLKWKECADTCPLALLRALVASLIEEAEHERS